MGRPSKQRWLEWQQEVERCEPRAHANARLDIWRFWTAIYRTLDWSSTREIEPKCSDICGAPKSTSRQCGCSCKLFATGPPARGGLSRSPAQLARHSCRPFRSSSSLVYPRPMGSTEELSHSPDGSMGEAVEHELCAVSRCLRAHLSQLTVSGAFGLTASRSSGAAKPADKAQAAAAPEPAGGKTVPPPQRAPAPALVQLSHSTQTPASSAQPEEKLQLHSEIEACAACALHSSRSQVVVSRGDGSSGLMFVGEGPGEEEDRRGSPFVGPAGQLLDKMIAAMKLDRSAVYVCNIVKCRPPGNRKPAPGEMSRCLPFLTRQIDLIEPRVIVALGATAVQGLLGTSGGITQLRGRWRLLRGKVPVMPTFHPAYLLRQPSAKRQVWADLQEVMRQLGS